MQTIDGESIARGLSAILRAPDRQPLKFTTPHVHVRGMPQAAVRIGQRSEALREGRPEAKPPAGAPLGITGPAAATVNAEARFPDGPAVWVTGGRRSPSVRANPCRTQRAGPWRHPRRKSPQPKRERSRLRESWARSPVFKTQRCRLRAGGAPLCKRADADPAGIPNSGNSAHRSVGACRVVGKRPVRVAVRENWREAVAAYFRNLADASRRRHSHGPFFSGVRSLLRESAAVDGQAAEHGADEQPSDDRFAQRVEDLVGPERWAGWLARG